VPPGITLALQARSVVVMSNKAMIAKANAPSEKELATLRQAAWQLEDAIAEKVCEKYPAENEARDLYFQVLRAQTWYTRGIFFMVLLTIFETPTWCDTSHTWEWGDPQERCLVYGEPTPTFPDGKPIEVMLSGITYLPPGYSIILEFMILALLFRKLWLEHQLQTKYFKPILGEDENVEYYPLKKIYFCMSMLLVSSLDCVVFAFIRPKLRVAFLARSALLCMLQSVIKLYRCITKIMVEVGTVAVFFVGFLFFFAWVSVMIFNGDASPPQHFSSFGKAFYGLFVAGVCDEFTDILIESYTRYRWIGILWFIFLLVVHLLFLSLVLDTLCAGYMRSEDEEKESVRTEKAEGVVRAFRILNENTVGDDHKVSQEVFMEFLDEYLRSPGVAGATKVTKEIASIGFRFVDRDGDGYIDEKEFAELCALTQYQMWTTPKDSGLKDFSPRFWNNPKVSAIRESVRDPDGAFEHVMTMVLGVNFILVIIETTYDLNKWEEPAWTEWLEFVFSFIYLGECMFKIGVSGWEFYTSSTSNVFDFGTTMLLLSTSIFESLLGGLSTYANILRLFRLLRVVKQLKGLDKVQFMVSTVVKLVFKAQDMLILLCVVLYLFTVVGVQLFGGLLYEENEKLLGTDYHEAKEFVLNFNDFLMAFGLWFVHLLCEFKPSFAAAIHRVSNIPKAWLLCGLFWAVAVCITFELVKAFTIEVYMDLKKKWDNKAKNGEEKPEIISEIERDYEERGRRYWFKCIAIDDDEYGFVQTAIEELLEDEGEEGEDGSEPKRRRKEED
jgi:hypothetical protein